jgi:hypothetical protein
MPRRKSTSTYSLLLEFARLALQVEVRLWVGIAVADSVNGMGKMPHLRDTAISMGLA